MNKQKFRYVREEAATDTFKGLVKVVLAFTSRAEREKAETSISEKY